jgi:hypothetical protein
MSISRALVVAASITVVAAPAFAQRSTIPTPASVLGFEPGADRHLPSWKQITDYFTALDKASPRVTVRTIGKTVLGRPFIVAIISDSIDARQSRALPPDPAQVDGSATAVGRESANGCCPKART